MTATPILANSCARAATAAEARYRIDAPIESRAARVIALDPSAARIVGSVAAHDWASARFFVCEAVPTGDFVLQSINGAPGLLDDELAGAHVVVMVATEDVGAACAYAIGRACWERGIMTAGLVVAEGAAAEGAVAALRPHARVLLPSADESDVVELLTALRA